MIFEKQKGAYVALLFCYLFVPMEICATDFNDCQAKDSLNLDTIFSYLHDINMSEHSETFPVKDHQYLVDDRRSLHNQLYESCISAQLTRELIKSLDSDELHRLYQVISTVAFYTNNPSHTEDLQLILLEKIYRDENVDGLLVKLFGLYISSRQFKMAEELIRSYPKVNLPNLPQVDVNPSINGRSLFHIDKSNTMLIRKPFVLPNDSHVIVITSAVCNPSKRFLSWLRTNVKLENIFSAHSTWITPVMSKFYLQRTINHNTRNPLFELKYSYNENDWSDILYWGTPTFYFYKNGKLVSQLVGWPKEGREEELKARLKEINLL